MLAFTIQPAGAPVGTPLPGPPTVTVRDSFANTARDSSAAIAVAIAANPGGGALAGTVTRNATAGVARFDDLSISRAGSGYTLVASSPGLSGAASAGFTIAATTGAIAGRVTRASDGAALSGASVEAIQAGLTKGSATTGADGTYSMAGLAPGACDVRVSAAGFETRSLPAVQVTAGGTATVNASLTAIPGPAIRITAPATGAILHEPATVVQGEVSDGVGATGVTLTVSATIQGRPLELPVPVAVNGGRFAALVGLTPGTVGLVAEARDQAGQSARASLTVTFQPDPPEWVQAAPPEVSPTSGFAPLTVTFTGTEAADPAVTALDLDVDGDGQPDFTLQDFATPPHRITHTYQAEGLYIAAMVVRDQAGQFRVTRVPINVLPLPDLASVWDGFRGALARGDVGAAASFIALEARERYRQAFTDLGADLPGVGAALGTITVQTVTPRYATATATRLRDGVPEEFLVHFIRDGDGVWRIASL